MYWIGVFYSIYTYIEVCISYFCTWRLFHIISTWTGHIHSPYTLNCDLFTLRRTQINKIQLLYFASTPILMINHDTFHECSAHFNSSVVHENLTPNHHVRLELAFSLCKLKVWIFQACLPLHRNEFITSSLVKIWFK